MLAFTKKYSSRTCAWFAFVLAALCAATILFVSCPSQAHADYRLVTGKEFFDNDETRGAFCELFVKGDSYTSLSINRQDDKWDRGVGLDARVLGTSSKFLFEWDPNCNNRKGGFKISAVIDQESNRWEIRCDPPCETTTYDTVGPHVWEALAKNNGNTIYETVSIDKELDSDDENLEIQRWALYKNDEDGTYRIQSLADGSYVMLYGDADSNELRLTESSDVPTDLEIYRLSPADRDTTYFGYADSWMDSLPDDALLSSVNIPGTHDTGTAYVGVHTYEQLAWKRDQKHYFQEQLNLGTRAFDIRCKRSDSSTPSADDIAIHHNIINCYDRDGSLLSLRTIWDQALEFLEENPREIIILDIAGYDSTSYAMAQLIKDEINKGSNCKLWRGMTVPTVGEARGKIVLMREYPIGKKTYDDFFYYIDTDDFGLDITLAGDIKRYDQGYAVPVELSDSSANSKGEWYYGEKGTVLYIQSAYEVDRSDKWNDYVTVTLDQTTNGTYTFGDGLRYVMNQTNCTGDPMTDDTKDTSRYVNQRIYENVGGYFSNKFTGIVNFNYIDAPLARMVYQTNFAEGADFFVYDIGDATVECTPDLFEYDGTAKNPDSVTVTYQGQTLVEGIDYDLSIENNIGPGYVTVYVNGKGKYTGCATGRYNIGVPPDVYFLFDYVWNFYQGAPPKAPVAYCWENENWNDFITYRYYDEDGNLLSEPPVNVGFYYLEASVDEAQGYLPGSTRIPWVIAPLPVYAQLDVSKTDAYDARIAWHGNWLFRTDIEGSIKFEVTNDDGSYSYEEIVPINDEKDAVLELENLPVATYEVTASYIQDGFGNYCAVPRKATFTSGKKNRSIEPIEPVELQVNGSRFVFDAVPTESDGADNAWSYKIISDSFQDIDPSLPPSIHIQANDSDYHKYQLVVYPENAGTALIEVTITDLNNNYNPCTTVVPVTVNRDDLTVTSAAYDTDGNCVDDFTYGEIPELEYRLSARGKYATPVDVSTDAFTNGHGKLEAVSLSQDLNAGNQEIPIVKKGTGSISYNGKTYDNVFYCRNYNLIFEPGTVEIGKAPATLVAEDAVGVYGAEEPTYSFTLEGLKEWDSPDAVLNGSSFTAALKDDMVFESLTPAYYSEVIMPLGSLPDESNYYVDDRKNGNLTIDKGDPRLTVTPPIVDKIYDGTSSGTSKEDFGFILPEDFDGGIPALSWERWDGDSHQYAAMGGNPVDVGSYRLIASTTDTLLYNADSATSEAIIWPASQGDPTVDTPLLKYTGEDQALGRVIPGEYGDEVHYSLGVPLDESNYQEYPTTPPMAKDVGTYSVYYYISPTDSNHYRITSNYRIEIGKADGPAAPAGLAGHKPSTVGGSDGTISGTTSDMEYSVDFSFASAIPCAGGETIVAPGAYYVRYAETGTAYAGASAMVTVPANNGAFTVTYSANGGTGTVPDDNNIYELGDTAVVLGNTGNLTKLSSVFSGWNTKADGTGTDCAEGSSITMESDVVLYAKWVSAEYEVLEGKSITHTKGSGVDEIVRIDRPLEEFDSVWINGVKIDPSNYALESGSTVITFGDEYLSTLPSGDHDFEYAFTEGMAHSTITVAESGGSGSTADGGLSSTGDGMNATPWMAALIVSSIVLGGIVVIRKKNARKGNHQR